MQAQEGMIRAAAERARRFCERLEIEIPLLSAPMSGVSTPELAAAFSCAGGLGVLAADLLEPEDIEREVRRVRAITDRPFAVNLRIPPRDRGDRAQALKVIYALGELRRELGLPEQVDLDAFREPDFDRQLEALLDCGVRAACCSFGGYREAYEERLHAAGVFILGAATTLREAKVQRSARADAVILQGAEAGGPRLYFESEPQESSVGLSVLLAGAGRAVNLPLVASGGISTPAGAVAALVAGASAVMVGTAVACSPESAAPDLMKRSMIAASDTATCLSDQLSGRLERVMKNGLIEALKRAGVASSGYPWQRFIMHDLMERAAQLGRADLLRMPVGQGADVFCCRKALETVRILGQALREFMSGQSAGPAKEQ
ncbi:nitronate monooxygenase [Mesosutterella sp. OilRF-GAM-744-9]|uniref:Propionate 3-nitronate monooxygenase n=1 Tax=Mesosutterella porci TaxID=2915351 RepID=A0ABS9MNX5_9BURK|nr:nitronate monooxygenase [Mesosutterella sp. oilRF-744-WT-GAM-9]MCG5030318.1 nitronate monooxygenase [Mesosutterella sp. oilRF-744-WT-GAM-9]MCI6530175.1 nitronate monooxygenase [Mesosutterella sp.]